MHTRVAGVFAMAAISIGASIVGASLTPEQIEQSNLIASTFLALLSALGITVQDIIKGWKFQKGTEPTPEEEKGVEVIG